MTFPSIFLNDDTPRARRTDPITSHASADGTTPKRAHSWLLIERALNAHAPMTAQEIVQFIRTQLGVWISESRVTTGVVELREKRVIEEAGIRVNPSNYKAQAYRIREDER